MPPTTIHARPPLDSFTLLADHQSQTPTTFYGAKPILHYHATAVRAFATENLVSKLPIFAHQILAGPRASHVEPNDNEDGYGNEMIVEVIDAFISSDALTLFNNTTSIGISIPYPAISLHAIQRLADPDDSSKELQGLYMQLELSDPHGLTDEDEADEDAIELTLIPSTSGDTVNTSAVQALFDAVSNCSNLHPDPALEEDENMDGGEGDSRIVFEGSVGYEGISGLPGVHRGAQDGGLPPPFPGSGGWITSENLSDYFDEEGNWIGGVEAQPLGEGAGRVRGRDEVDPDGVNGHDKEDNGDDNKRPRTD